MKTENRIKELGISLPPSSPPGAMYVPVKRTGNALYVSGQVPMRGGKPVFTGKVGTERSIEYAQDAARMCVENMLSAVKDYLGDLDRVKNVVKLQAFVNSESGFDKQHIVINAASQMLYDIFGEAGRHARTAVGTNQLPMDVTVEIEAVFETEPPAPITLDDLALVNYLSSPDMSPDGTKAVYVTQRADGNKFTSYIYEISATGGSPAQITDVPAELPRYSPDGASLAYLCDKSGEKQIWLRTQDGEHRQLTALRHGVTGFTWSNSGGHIAFEASLWPDDEPFTEMSADEKAQWLDKRENEPIVIEDLMYKLDETGFFDGSRSCVGIIEVESGQAKILTDRNINFYLPAWSHDDSALAFYGCPRGDDKAIDREIFTCLLDGSELRQISDDELIISSSPVIFHDDIYYCAAQKEENGAYSQRLFKIPAGGGEKVLVLEHSDNCYGVDNSAVSRTAMGKPNPNIQLSDGYIYFCSGYNGTVPLYRVRAEGGKPERVIDGKMSVHSFCAPKAGRIAYTRGDTMTIAELFVFDMAAGVETRLTYSNSWLNDRLLSTPEEMWADNGDAKIHGWVMRPAEYQPGVKYPAVLDIHGGPQCFYSHDFWFELQYLAANGMAVVYCDPRGSAGFGAEHILGEHAWGENSKNDLLAFLDAAIKKGFIDEQRLGATGGSYGGQMTNRMISTTDRFKAAVTQRNLCNLATSYGTGDIGFVRSDKEFKTMLKMLTDRAKSRSSTLNKIDRVKTPLLILHGTDDYRCSFEQAEQMFIAMKDRNPEVPVKLVAFPGENHGITRTGRLRSQQIHLDEMTKWFVKYLKEAQI